MEPIRQSSTSKLDESVADPNRPAQYIAGLTDFLVQDHFEKTGVFSKDKQNLFKHWKYRVSANH